MKSSELKLLHKSLREIANLARGGHLCREKADSLIDLHKMTVGWDLPEKRTVHFPSSKWCPSCSQLWAVRVDGFNCDDDATWVKKTEEKDGLQPFCRNCQMKGRSTDEYKWTEFRRAIRNRDPSSEAKWSSDLYIEFVDSCEHKCSYCKWDVRHWGNGYHVDRISSKCGYDPNNTTLCCWPCNKSKGTGNAQAYRRRVEKLMKDYQPTGLIRWDEEDPLAYEYIDFSKSRVPEIYVISKVKPNIQGTLF